MSFEDGFNLYRNLIKQSDSSFRSFSRKEASQNFLAKSQIKSQETLDVPTRSFYGASPQTTSTYSSSYPTMRRYYIIIMLKRMEQVSIQRENIWLCVSIFCSV